MYFDGAVWDAIWKGRFERCGSASSYDAELGRSVSRYLATREMLIKALARGVGGLGDVGGGGGEGDECMRHKKIRSGMSIF